MIEDEDFESGLDLINRSRRERMAATIQKAEKSEASSYAMQVSGIDVETNPNALAINANATRRPLAARERWGKVAWAHARAGTPE